MRNFSQIIGENIKTLMELRNISINELAENIGVTRQTMSKYLSGSSIIDTEKLFIISKLFNKPITYFIDQNQEELSFMFRAHDPEHNFSLLQKTKIESFMSKVDDLYKLSDNIFSYIPEQYNLHDIKLNRKKLPNSVEILLEKIATEQRELLDIGEATGSELVRSFERKGVRVIFKSLEDHNLFAVSAFHDKKGSFILINDDENITEERKIFSMIHEYAHLIFHRELYKQSQYELKYNNYIIDVNEKIANTFAGYFLIPRNMLSKYDYILKEKLTYPDLFYIKKEFKVSLGALVMALKKYEYIDDVTNKRIWDHIKRHGHNKIEPEPMNKFEKNEKYKTIVKKLFISEKIGVSKVAEILDIKTIDARKLTKEWLLDEKEI